MRNRLKNLIVVIAIAGLFSANLIWAGSTTDPGQPKKKVTQPVSHNPTVQILNDAVTEEQKKSQTPMLDNVDALSRRYHVPVSGLPLKKEEQTVVTQPADTSQATAVTPTPVAAQVPASVPASGSTTQGNDQSSNRLNNFQNTSSATLRNSEHRLQITGSPTAPRKPEASPPAAQVAATPQGAVNQPVPQATTAPSQTREPLDRDIFRDRSTMLKYADENDITLSFDAMNDDARMEYEIQLYKKQKRRDEKEETARTNAQTAENARATAEQQKAQQDKSAGIDRSIRTTERLQSGSEASPDGTYEAGIVQVHKQFAEDTAKSINSNTTGNLAQVGQGIASTVKDPETAAKATAYATYMSSVGGLVNAGEFGSLAHKHGQVWFENENLKNQNIAKREAIESELNYLNHDSVNNAADIAKLTADKVALDTQIKAQNDASWSNMWSAYGNGATAMVSLAGAGAMSYVAHENEVMERELSNKKKACEKDNTQKGCPGFKTANNCDGDNFTRFGCPGYKGPTFNVCDQNPLAPGCPGANTGNGDGGGNPWVTRCPAGLACDVNGNVIPDGGPPTPASAGLRAGGGGGGSRDAFSGKGLTLDDLPSPSFTNSDASKSQVGEDSSVGNKDTATDQRFPSAGGGGGGTGLSDSGTGQANGGDGSTLVSKSTPPGSSFNITGYSGGDIGTGMGSGFGGFDIGQFMPNWMQEGEQGGGPAIRQIASENSNVLNVQILGQNSPSLFTRVTKAHQKKAHELKEEVF